MKEIKKVIVKFLDKYCGFFSSEIDELKSINFDKDTGKYTVTFYCLENNKMYEYNIESDEVIKMLQFFNI